MKLLISVFTIVLLVMVIIAIIRNERRHTISGILPDLSSELKEIHLGGNNTISGALPDSLSGLTEIHLPPGCLGILSNGENTIKGDPMFDKLKQD